MSADGDLIRETIEVLYNGGRLTDERSVKTDAALARLEAAAGLSQTYRAEALAANKARYKAEAQRDTLAKLIADWLPDMDDDMQQAFRAACRGGAGGEAMSADGDLVRAWLPETDERFVAALAALARLEAAEVERDELLRDQLRDDGQLEAAEAQRDALAEALRPFKNCADAFEDSGGLGRLTDGEWLNIRSQLMTAILAARAALAEAGLE